MTLDARRPLSLLLSLLVVAPACDDAEADAPAETLRDARYCEILLGTADLAAGTVAIDVYNTVGLNDCPQEQWAALDVDALKAEAMADVVILNGPRHWVLDEIVQSALLDTTVRSFGEIEMRKAGALELGLAEVAVPSAPYTPRTVRRDTTWRYFAGASVYELVDPEGAVYDMQSYSTQQVEQDEASLAGLGEALTLAAGWSFRSRVLAADLQVTAVDGLATVVQDERGNTYQRSQQ